MKIRLFKPSLGKEELKSIRDSFDRSWIGLGPKVKLFENEFSKFIGAKYCLALNSATSALHLALKALQLKENDKVLVPSLTFISSALTILYNKQIPVFVDSDPINLNICPRDLDNKINKYENIKAIILVHFAGHLNNLDEILKICKKNNIKIIEDCAHTLGSKFKNKKIGTIGDIGCFSFEEKKCITTGDGGMLVTNNLNYFNRIKELRWFGIDKDTWARNKYYLKDISSQHWRYEINEIGYKYNMNDLSAAIGLEQLKKVEKFNKLKNRIIKTYLKELENLKYIKPLLPFDFSKNNSYWLFGIRYKKRDLLIKFLKSSGISTGVHYIPLTLQPLFKNYKNQTPVIEKIWKEFITLPLFTDLKLKEVKFITNKLKLFEKKYHT